MTLTVKIHLKDEAAFLAEMEGLPAENATILRFANPKLADGKRISWITPGAKYFIVGMTRVNFIEVMSSNEERLEVVEWFRHQ
jgi:hypothetical protein